MHLPATIPATGPRPPPCSSPSRARSSATGAGRGLLFDPDFRRRPASPATIPCPCSRYPRSRPGCGGTVPRVPHVHGAQHRGAGVTAKWVKVPPRVGHGRFAGGAVIASRAAPCDTHDALRETLARWATSDAKPLVLMIDQIDALIGDTLLAVLRQLRVGYPERPGRFPQCVVLCGMRDVRDYRIRSSTN